MLSARMQNAIMKVRETYQQIRQAAADVEY